MYARVVRTASHEMGTSVALELPASCRVDLMIWYTVVTVHSWGKPPALRKASVQRMASSWARRPRSQEKSEQLHTVTVRPGWNHGVY